MTFMTSNAIVLCVIYLLALIALSIPLGAYMARVYSNEATLAQRVIGPLERVIYRVAGVRADEEMTWKRYVAALLSFNLFGALLVYALQRLQAVLPVNPEQLGAVSPEVAFNTAVSFATNTNWQTYGGETTMSYLTQMLALTVQNFLSAATGMAVLVALIRGLSRSSVQGLGSFWVDMTRGTLYVLLPLALVFSLVLVSQGAVQTFDAHATATTLESHTEQVIALGPAASQIAIKQLGTNGGGFFNTNSAHPLENGTPLSNFLQLLALLLIPTALCFTFGAMVKDKRQGWSVLSAMLLIFVPLLVLCVSAEQAGNPMFTSLGVDQTESALQAGGNMEGKEVRHGIASSALWATATTAASNGSVNAMLPHAPPSSSPNQASATAYSATNRGWRITRSLER